MAVTFTIPRAQMHFVGTFWHILSSKCCNKPVSTNAIQQQRCYFQSLKHLMHLERWPYGVKLRQLHRTSWISLVTTSMSSGSCTERHEVLIILCDHDIRNRGAVVRSWRLVDNSVQEIRPECSSILANRQRMLASAFTRPSSSYLDVCLQSAL